MGMNIEQILDDVVKSGKIAGATAFLGNRNGMISSHVAGLADPAAGTAMATDTIFQIASMTKAITSVAAMQLVEQGKLTLDAPIGALLPALADLGVMSGFNDSGAVTLRPAKRAITLRHLLTHTSGLGYPFMSADILRTYALTGPPAPASLASISAPLLFDPGDRWEYGVSTDWVGLAVEAAAGMLLGRYMAEAIFEPLGMTDTGFTLSTEQMSRRAAMLSRTDNGILTPFPVEIGGGADAEFEGGGGGLMSSGPDYMRFVRMILNNGALNGITILKPDSVAEMTRNQIGDLRAGAMASVMPQFSRHYDSFPDMHTGWGLGFLINPEPSKNGRAAGSLAWAGIANSFYWIDPVNDLAGVLMMQILPFADPDALTLYQAFEQAAYAR